MRQILARLWGGALIVMVLLLLVGWSNGTLAFDADILDLLPQERELVQHRIAEEFRDEQSRRIIVLVGHTSESVAIEEGTLLRSLFISLGLSERRDLQGEMFRLYFPHRYNVLSNEMKDLLKDPSLVSQRIEKLLFSPESSLYSRLLDKDPLLLFPSLLSGMVPKGVIFKEEVPLVVKDQKHYAIISGTLPDKALPQRLEQHLQELKERCSSCEVKWSGFSKFASTISSTMKREVSVISTGSLLGVVIVIFITFLSLTPLLVTVLASGAGTLLAVLVCEWYFGRLHLIALALGSTLFGVAADYSFHYLAHRQGRPEMTPEESLKAIFPGMTNGMITTVLGYGVLCFTPFPFLQQVGLFSALAAFGGYLTVVLLYPSLVSSPRVGSTLISRVGAYYLSLWRRKSYIPTAALILVVLLSLFGVGVRTNDDVRGLQSLPLDLVAEEQEIRRIVSREGDAGRFLLVEGSDEEELLQRLESVENALRGFAIEGVSKYLPSRSQQERNREVIREAVERGRGRLLSVGLLEETIEKLERELTSSSYLTPSEWVESAPLPDLKQLWRGKREGRFYSIALVSDPAWQMASQLALPGVYAWDTTAQISGTLRDFRTHGGVALLLAYSGIAIAFFYRFGVKLGGLVMVPAILASTSALGATVIAGQEVNLMHLVALMLVLSIGVDYAVYFAEGRGDDEETMTAVLLSASTAIIAFAMLLCSSSPILRNVGLICVVGLSVSVILSPIACVRSGEMKNLES